LWGHRTTADGTLSGMTVWTLAEVEQVVRMSWGADTCDPDDLADWRRDNPPRGQCGATALVLNDLFGGDLVLGEVRVAGERTGVHYWNRFGATVELDLTRGQFRPDEVVVGATIVPRPAGPPRRCRAQYELLRDRVLTHLWTSTNDVGVIRLGW
jgi:hypothetical protein